MKKVLVLFALIAAFYGNAQTQTELNVGLPTGDSADFVSLGIGLKANYMFPVTDEIKVGPSAGILVYFGKDQEQTIGSQTYTVEVDPFSYVPLAAAGEYTIDERFVLGLDLGYALSFGEDREGGFYYRPNFGYLITEKFTAQLAYSAISANGGTISHFGLGLVFSK